MHPAGLVAPPMHWDTGKRGHDAPRSRGKAERSEQSMSKSVDSSTDVGLEVFSTCTQSTDGNPEAYAQRVADVARWSEQAGCKGILVYSDNRLVDAWLASHIIIQNTTRLCPLVAVQPITCTRTPLRSSWRRSAICTGDGST